MKAAVTAQGKDLAEAIKFHGHLCPGLVIGYLAGKVGMERLRAIRSEDEELIAIVENDSCAVDAVQVLTGCTTGKGNLFMRDYGKMVFTFAVRPSGKAVRVSLIRREKPGEPEQDREQRIEYMLSARPEELFSVREEKIKLPDTAHIRENAVCERCGEMMMETRSRSVGGSVLCMPCAEDAAKQ